MTATESPAVGTLVGAAGGVGATRLSVEVAATLARDGLDAVVVDAAFATQGLSQYVAGRIEPDLTAVLTDEGADLADALVALPGDPPGRLAACPARAPFERLARAKGTDPAAALETLIEAAAETADRVVVDAPPVASNPSLAGVYAADRVGVVTLPTARGTDALQAVDARLADLGVETDLVVANRTVGPDPPPDADVAVPRTDPVDVPREPACLTADDAFAAGIAATAESLFDVRLDVEISESLLERARRVLG